MLHRATWISATVLAVVAVGAGVGYWGYGEKTAKETYARQAETNYASSFHNMVNNIRDMRSELAKSMLSSDAGAFQSHLSDVSRLCYAAQTDLGRLPSNFTPDSNLQSYLHEVDTNVRKWIKADEKPSDRPVENQIQNYYTASGAIVSDLSDMQGQLDGKTNAWLTNNAKTTTLAAQGMKRVNTHVASFASLKMPTRQTPAPKANPKLQQLPTITAQQAINQVASVVGQKNHANWRAKLMEKGKSTAHYQVNGANSGAHISAEVSQHGGKLFSLYNDRSINASKYDFATASKDAKHWLAQHGFANVQQLNAAQYDHTALFTFSPTLNGVPVISQSIQVHVALDNGQITDFNATPVYTKPVGTVPARKLTVAQLQKKLNPDFQVKMSKPVIVQDENSKYVPAAAFYGTLHHDTFCILLSAVDGSEVKVDQLT